MNPRRIVVEDRVLSLADELAHQAPLLAARLRETVPGHSMNADMHEGVMRAALADTARSVPAAAARVERILAALDDLPAHIGRRGHVWIGTSSDEDGRNDGYDAYWADGDGRPRSASDLDPDETVCVDNWLEQSPGNLDRDEVLAWARARSHVIRCSLDPEDEVAVAVRRLVRPD